MSPATWHWHGDSFKSWVDIFKRSNRSQIDLHAIPDPILENTFENTDSVPRPPCKQNRKIGNVNEPQNTSSQTDLLFKSVEMKWKFQGYDFWNPNFIKHFTYKSSFLVKKNVIQNCCQHSFQKYYLLWRRGFKCTTKTVHPREDPGQNRSSTSPCVS